MMRENNLDTSDFSLLQLSEGPHNTPWAIAVFAHNAAKTIQHALDSIDLTTEGKDIAIYVLANGCNDSTVDKVRNSAATIDNLWLVETRVADKANAWNLFVHDILPEQRVEQLETFFFMDGDVTLVQNTLPLLASALDEVRSAEAAGAMPASGRDKKAWRQRMPVSGMLAGACYALRTGFVQLVREQKVRMPTGLIGEDFLVSWLVANNAWRSVLPDDNGARCVFHSDAEFAFRSLSPWRLSDYRTYMHRKWRYTLRGIQHQMLVLLLLSKGLRAMPRDVKELYCNGPLPSRLVWCGLDTPLRTIAVQWIRTQGNRN